MSVSDLLGKIFGFSPDQIRSAVDQQNQTAVAFPEWIRPDLQIPIRLMNERPVFTIRKGASSWGSQDERLTANVSRMIVGRNFRRRGVTIVNNGGSAVAIAPSQSNCSLTSAGKLAAGQAIVLDMIGEVWAISATDTSLQVFALYEDGGVD